MSINDKTAAKRLEHFQTGIFAELNDKKDDEEKSNSK